MGCDIHLYVEVRKDDKWVSVDKWTKEDNRLDVDYDHRYFTTRSYDTFAILADVRNGRGFAGIKTGAGFNPISPPKGMPADASLEVAALAEQWDSDGHSHSWLSLAELLEFDWTQTTTKQGWVNGPQYERWNRWDRGRGFGPENYCGAVSGGGVKHIDTAGMHLAVMACKDEADLKALENTYCCVQWQTSYYRSASSFYAEVMSRLLRLGKPEDVRIVFFFDN